MLEHMFDIRFALVSSLGIWGPLFLLALALEYFYFKRKGMHRQVFSFEDGRISIALTLMYQFGEVLFGFLLAPVYLFLFENRLFSIPINWWGLLLLFVAQDFCYYWFHRFSHELKLMWASHNTHHSSTFMNFTVAFRQSLTYNLSGMFVFWLPLPLIGFDPVAVLWMVGLSLSYQFFVHTEAIGKLGPLEFFLNTPSHHRVHHNRDPDRMNSNFGGILILWDRLFGTFVEETAIMVHEYGTPALVKSKHPWEITVLGWREIFQENKTRKGFFKKLSNFISRPEHHYLK